MQVPSALPDPSPSPNLSAPTLAAASLELKAEKQSAHSDLVRSVAFSPDGKTIVSGSDDKTIKVWDAGASALTPTNPSPNLSAPSACGSFPGAQGGERECAQRLRQLRGLLTRWQDHRLRLRDKTLKVWDAGVGTDTPP